MKNICFLMYKILTKMIYLKLLTTIMTCILCMHIGYSQKGKLSVSIDKDTMSFDENLKIIFSMENLEGNYVPPSFEGFKVISGPNVSSSFIMNNSEVSQSKSYTYLLRPQIKGNVEIGSASVENDGHVLLTDPIQVVVVEDSVDHNTNKKNSRSFIYESDPSNENKTEAKKNTKKRVLRKI